MAAAKHLPAIVMPLFIASCATSNWHLNGRTQQDFAQHNAICNQYAESRVNQHNINSGGQYVGQSTAGGPDALGGIGLLLLITESSARAHRFDECMTSYGYTKAAAPKSKPLPQCPHVLPPYRCK